MLEYNLDLGSITCFQFQLFCLLRDFGQINLPLQISASSSINQELTMSFQKGMPSRSNLSIHSVLTAFLKPSKSYVKHCKYIHIYIYLHIYMYLYKYMCVYMYMCVCVYTQTHTQEFVVQWEKFLNEHTCKTKKNTHMRYPENSAILKLIFLKVTLQPTERLIPQILLINSNPKRSSNPPEFPQQHPHSQSTNQHLLEHFHEFSNPETIFFLYYHRV